MVNGYCEVGDRHGRAAEEDVTGCFSSDRNYSDLRRWRATRIPLARLLFVSRRRHGFDVAGVDGGFHLDRVVFGADGVGREKADMWEGDDAEDGERRQRFLEFEVEEEDFWVGAVTGGGGEGELGFGVEVLRVEEYEGVEGAGVGRERMWRRRSSERRMTPMGEPDRRAASSGTTVSGEPTVARGALETV
ncbi:hypothetical protein STAS_02127 [Striga asiatica]|uniref:Uncharacterized protein n=1 Tax=Striga asiatica TaxID=4170 RepID=A0A5A7P113_STRAF|nr:hypothetical protein STAS_02127 [Striga asiatica]